MVPKKKTGLTRIIKAVDYSSAGLKSAWKHEAAFRQELIGVVGLSVIVFFLDKNNVEKALLMASVMMVVVVELLNSAIEAITDRIGLEYNPMAKRAKDMGSAAVFVSIVIAIIIWAFILI